MCKFKPFNKHLLVEKFPEVKNQDLSTVLIPDDVKVGKEQRYNLVKFICGEEKWHRIFGCRSINDRRGED